MARIVYAVAGEGFGHASRTHLIGQRFLDAGHEVIFAASLRALQYLRPYFGDRVKEIFGLSYDYHKGYVAPAATLWKNLSRFPQGHRVNREFFTRVCAPFGPDLVVTDFEPFSAWWARRHRVPFISIDNEHLLILCRLDQQFRDLWGRFSAGVVVRCHYFGAQAYVITSFFQAPARSPKAVLAPPIVRPAIARLQPSDAGHVVVYATTGTHEDQWREVLGRLTPQKFVLYGFNKNLEWKNCVFKEASTEGFATDLASARGVIASAGYSLISECLYLRKKMLLLPLVGQYEQLINARYIEKLGLGVWSKEVDEAMVSRFLERIAELLPPDGRILWPDNEKFFETLQGVLARLDLRTPIRI
ncbi:MAG: hypothetical protein M1376_10470 [Planctomycetes bacterium]|nr:hypothetical protein [Planctomycetota bacterium]